MWSGQQRTWFCGLVKHKSQEQRAYAAELLELWESCLMDCQAWSLERALDDLRKRVDPFRGQWEFVGQAIRAAALQLEADRRQLERQLERRRQADRERAEYLAARQRRQA